MKRWLAILGGVFLVLVLAVWAAAAFLVKPEALRELVVEQARGALGREVQLGELDLDLFPAPAIRAASISVDGGANEPSPLLEAKEVRLRIAVLPLLGGRIVLSSVELREPAIQLPVDEDGLPRAPELGPAGGAPSDGQTPAPSGEAPAEESGGAPALAIQSVVVSKASLRAGEWEIRDLDVEGDLDTDGTASLALDAELPGLGEIRDGKVDLAGLLGGGELSVDAAASLADIDLAALAQRLELVPDPLGKLAGRLSGPVRASLVGSEVKAAQADLKASGLALQADAVEIEGDVPIRAELGGDLFLDLTDAVVRAPSVNKPAGEKLAVSGKLGREPSAAALQSLVLTLGPNQIPVTPKLAEQRVEIGATSIELAPLAKWVDTKGTDFSGTVKLEPLAVKLEPLEVRGNIALQGVKVGLEHGPVELSGLVAARGKDIRTEGLKAVVGGQTIELQGGYDLERGTVQLDVGADQAKLESLLTALTGDSKLTGILVTKVNVSGVPEIDKLTGSGTLSIEPGKVVGFSLIDTVLGKLGPIVQAYAQSRGKDLSRYQQEDFKEMKAEFQLADGKLQLRPASLDYRYARAELRGSVDLVQQTVDLKGQIEFPPEVTSDLIGKETDRVLVVPIDAIRGPMDGPSVEINTSMVARTLAQVGLAKQLDDKLGKRLEEKLGKEKSDALKGVLDGLLGGRRREPEPEAEPEPEREPEPRRERSRDRDRESDDFDTTPPDDDGGFNP
jgi:AsmA protein